MKRVNNIYKDLVDINKIHLIYDKQIKKNTKNKVKLEKFENNYVSNIIYINNLLKLEKYEVGKYNIFLIKEPKTRIVMSQNIIDKIVNHLVSEYVLIKYFDNLLINENIATRKGKGTHYGIKLLKKYLNQIKMEPFYILKFDIAKYFFNLDHKIIKNQISNRIKDKQILNLLNKIIDSTNEPYVNKTIKKLGNIKGLPKYKSGKGLPIGNMSSQILAILYLNELDHYIKETLKIKYYIRYMDDGILLHRDKEYLEYCLHRIKDVIATYQLELNDKTRICSSMESFEFLGFRYYIKHNKVIMKVKNQTKRKFKRKLKKLYKNKQYVKLLQVKSSYIGHLHYGSTNKLIYLTIRGINDIMLNKK